MPQSVSVRAFVLLLAGWSAACAVPLIDIDDPAESAVVDGGARDGSLADSTDDGGSLQLSDAGGVVLGDGGSQRSEGGKAAADGGLKLDAGPPGLDAGVADDAGSPSRDAGTSIDAGPQPHSDGGPPCAPTRTTCNEALECGRIPSGCPGVVVSCGDCVGGETWCMRFESSQWSGRVYNCVQAARGTRPDWFDGELVVAAHAAEYVREMASCANGRGAVCIVDANAPENEIRCREENGDVAENLSVRTYGGGGRWVARYTSSCTPAFF
jgi:hypothetical protein